MKDRTGRLNIPLPPVCDELNITIGISLSNGISSATEVMKEATLMKNAGRYDDACDKIREAFVTDGANMLNIGHRLRLPMYLQLAEKNDEGWDELCRLFKTEKLDFIEIVNQMRIFCEKEGVDGSRRNLNLYLKWADAKKNAQIEKNKTQKTIRQAQENISPFQGLGIVNGFVFRIDPSISVPLRILLQHLEVHTDPFRPHPPVEIYKALNGHSSENCYGAWGAVMNAICSESMNGKDEAKLMMRIESSEDKRYPPRRVYPELGAVFESEYFKFLIEIRKIVESDESIESRVNKLRNMLLYSKWEISINLYRGIDSIIDRLFPPSIFFSEGSGRSNEIIATSDETLLRINGVGPAKLKAIRARPGDYVLTRSDDVLR